jgi:protein TonB
MSDHPRRKWLVRGAISIVAVSGALGAISAVRGLLGTGERPKQIVHNISLIKQPPPPPPKPPDKPPDPPKIKEEVKIPDEQPKPADKPADDKPPSDKPLALDAAGGAGSDNFGLGSRIGGSDLLSTGGGGAYYSGLIQRQFYEALTRNKKLQHQQFQVTVRVVIGSDGKVERSELVASSGNKDLDQQITAALADVTPLKEVPPSNLRLVEVRLTNHV